MATLKDYYNDEGDKDGAQTFISSSYWFSQAFTASSAYTIGSVKVYIYRNGDPGTITASIRAAEEQYAEAWRPTGADLCSGTVSGTSFADTTHTWVEISFSVPYSLTSGTHYTIVLRQTASGKLQWNDDGSSPTYTGGNYARSTNSGSSWTALTTIDFLFETYDSYVFSPPSDIVTVKKLVAAAANKIWYEDI